MPTPYGPDGGIPPQCHNDGECDAGLNGRCQWTTQQFGINPPYQLPLCSYDQCLSDQDCHGGVCDCRGAAVYGLWPGNECLPGNCVVDSDCASGFCSPAPATGWCSLGFFCHTARDECHNTSDCPQSEQCTFTSFGPGYWQCLPWCLDGGA
ncbi:MAG TPA: hypothetical protein VLM85_24415 [Polyangiaceae bacterium]|nr:hypothetical protein [Polyangiaceae bacterium]